MSTTSKGDEAGDDAAAAAAGGGEDGVVSPADQAASVTVVNCSSSANHSETRDPELGSKAPANTTVRYRSEARRRWSSLERYLVVVCVVLLLTSGNWK